MSDVMNFLKMLLIAQLFYSFAITGIIYATPAGALNYVGGFDDITDSIDIESVGQDVQEGLTSQTEIPVIELGALIFYSGNLLIDLVINFLFALPQMIGMLVNGIFLLLNVDNYVFALVEIFASVAITITYFIAIIQFISGMRSGRIV